MAQGRYTLEFCARVLGKVRREMNKSDNAAYGVESTDSLDVTINEAWAQACRELDEMYGTSNHEDKVAWPAGYALADDNRTLKRIVRPRWKPEETEPVKKVVAASIESVEDQDEDQDEDQAEETREELLVPRAPVVAGEDTSTETERSEDEVIEESEEYASVDGD